MAGFEVNFGDDFLKDLLGADISEMAEEMLNGAAPVMAESLQKTIRESNHVESGELAESIRTGKAKKSKNGAWIVNVYPKGYSTTKFLKKSKTGKERKVSNAAKLIWIEYGIPGRQPARPIITRAVGRIKEKVLQEMQNVYRKRTGIKE